MWIEEKAGWDIDMGEPLTDILIGYKGEQDRTKKIHIAIDVRGEIQFVRYLDGEPLFSRKGGIGNLKDLGLE
jgi:hypothetical protein